jgi:hypothetical protein
MLGQAGEVRSSTRVSQDGRKEISLTLKEIRKGVKLTIKVRGNKDKYNGFTFGNIKVILDLNATLLPCGITGKIAIDDFYKDKTKDAGVKNTLATNSVAN